MGWLIQRLDKLEVEPLDALKRRAKEADELLMTVVKGGLFMALKDLNGSASVLLELSKERIAAIGERSLQRSVVGVGAPRLIAEPSRCELGAPGVEGSERLCSSVAFEQGVNRLMVAP